MTTSLPAGIKSWAAGNSVSTISHTRPKGVMPGQGQSQGQGNVKGVAFLTSFFFPDFLSDIGKKTKENGDVLDISICRTCVSRLQPRI